MRKIILALGALLLCIGAGCVPRTTVPTNGEEPATETTTVYSSDEYGITIDLGTSFTTNDDGTVAFGPLVPHIEGPYDGPLFPKYTLRVIPARDIAAIREVLVVGEKETLRETNNGLHIATYTTANLCYNPAAEILGKKYNYVLESRCDTKDEDGPVLRAIAGQATLHSGF